MSVPPDKIRHADGGSAQDGTNVFNWQVTGERYTDAVRLPMPPPYVLPIVFVPGIMGSNLRSSADHTTKIWRLDNHSWLNFGPMKDKPLGLVSKMASAKAGERQKLMHPDRTEVDPRGNIPSDLVGSVFKPEQYTDRGWGEIAEGSYHKFLLLLERRLNGQGYNPARWQDFYHTAFSAMPKPGQPAPEPKLYPGISMSMHGGFPIGSEINTPTPLGIKSDDLIKRANYRMPVYAFGYNWLASNAIAGQKLKERVSEVIDENNNSFSKCNQVILVTHSMGGLVARACQKLSGMNEKIAGVVHGVMPAVGAAVAYRRCKVGMRDEDFFSGLVLGETGREVTTVFAQAPGALQLLPTTQYTPGWLTFTDKTDKSLAPSQPANGDPYADIYLSQDHWWALIQKEWLQPSNGAPIKWFDYEKSIGKAKTFHGANGIENEFHPNTYVYYGKDGDQASFEGINWRIVKGVTPDHKPHPDKQEVPNLSFEDVRSTGGTPMYVGGQLETNYAVGMGYGVASSYQSAYWNIECSKQDGGGDGTVPVSSGAKPREIGKGKIKQQFGLSGFAHEGSYKNSEAQKATLYALYKIAGTAEEPA